MTLLGLKKVGLVAFPPATVFSVQGNVFIQSQYVAGAHDQNEERGLRHMVQGGSTATAISIMPYGGKIVFMKLRRHVPSFGAGTRTFTVRKNGVATALALSDGGNNSDVDSGGENEIEFNQGDIIDIEVTGGNFDSNDFTVGYLLALNVGSTTP